MLSEIQPRTKREQIIWAVCDELLTKLKDHSKITGELIREHLALKQYSKGSPNEIYKYRKSWWLARGLTPNSNSLNKLLETSLQKLDIQGSQAVLHLVNNNSDQLFQQAIKQIKEQLIQEAKTKLQDLTIEFEKNIATAAAKVELLEDANRIYLEENQNLQEQVTALEQTNLNLSLENQIASANQASAQQQVADYQQELHSKQELIAQLQVQLEQTRQEFFNSLNQQQQTQKQDLAYFKEIMEQNRQDYLLTKDELTTDIKKLRQQEQAWQTKRLEWQKAEQNWRQAEEKWQQERLLWQQTEEKWQQAKQNWQQKAHDLEMQINKLQQDLKITQDTQELWQKLALILVNHVQ